MRCYAYADGRCAPGLLDFGSCHSASPVCKLAEYLAVATLAAITIGAVHLATKLPPM